jgi:hypothetical protein
MDIRLSSNPTAPRRYRAAGGAHRCRIKSWRAETAAAAIVATKSFRSGKLKSTTADSVISHLRLAK